jgi:hypothetical protein
MEKMTITFTGSIRKNIIFLDIDGVLNGYNRWNLLGWKFISLIKNEKLKQKLRLLYIELTDPAGVHKRKVKKLSRIIKATNAKVVMSSSWRFGWWNTPYENQYNDQKKLTDLFIKYNIEVIDITPGLIDHGRGDEIKEWLKNHEDLVKRFVILDDERFDLESFAESHLVQTSSSNGKYSGLKNTHVKKAIKILKK